MAVLLALQRRAYASKKAGALFSARLPGDSPDDSKADAGKNDRIRGDDARADILSSTLNAPGTITTHRTETGRYTADCATNTGFICLGCAETPVGALMALYGLLNELGADYLRECGVALNSTAQPFAKKAYASEREWVTISL